MKVAVAVKGVACCISPINALRHLVTYRKALE